MEQVQIISVNPEEMKNHIIQEVKNELDALKSELDELTFLFQLLRPTTYLSRLEVSKMLKVSLVTLNTWNKNGTLKAVGIGGRVLYRQEDIDYAIIKL